MKIQMQFHKTSGNDLFPRKAVKAFLVFLFCISLLVHPGYSQSNATGSGSSTASGSEVLLYPESHGPELTEISSALYFSVISPDNLPENDHILRVETTDLILLSLAAEKSCLHLRSDVIKELELHRVKLLAGKYLRKVSREWDMSRKRLEEFYYRNQERYINPEAVRIRHILLHERNIAYTVLLRLMSGESFESLVGCHTKDLSTVLDGGYLGWFSRGQLPQYLERAIFQLEPGAFAGPLETPYGFHIIQCIEKRPSLQLTYPEVSSHVYQDLLGYYVNEEIRSLENLLVLPGSGDN